MYLKAFEHDYAGLAEMLEEQMLSYIEPTGTTNPPLGRLAESHPYFPHYFSGNWPVLGVSELAPVPGQPGITDTRLRIRIIRIGLRVYVPSLTRKDLGEEFHDGREAAKRISRRVFSAWVDSFFNDEVLRTNAMGGDIAIANIDMGDADKVGSPFWLPGREGLTRLWIHAWEAHVPL